MRVEEFHYPLPPERVAYYPAGRREAARLLVLRPGDGSLEHRSFCDLEEYLSEGDLLVLNNSRVIPARIRARKATGGTVEFLFLDEESRRHSLSPCGRRGKTFLEQNYVSPSPYPSPIKREGILVADSGGRRTVKVNATWSSSKPLRPPAELFGPGEVHILVESVEGTVATLQLALPPRYSSIHNWLQDWGQMPLPPYIKRAAEPQDSHRYQTVYAQHDGSVAAPTAGLHFTSAHLERLKENGIDHVFVTLHVGLGTFRPVLVEEVEQHQMHQEWYEVGDEAAGKINDAKRIIAVGTTAVRALESSFSEPRFCHSEPQAKNLDPSASPQDDRGASRDDKQYSLSRKRERARANSGWTSLFIYPGYSFKAVDALITNFHYPKSTLMMLTSAFAGRENLMRAYEEAIARNYRMLSYGDAMLII